MLIQRQQQLRRHKVIHDYAGIEVEPHEGGVATFKRLGDQRASFRVLKNNFLRRS